LSEPGYNPADKNKLLLALLKDKLSLLAIIKRKGQNAKVLKKSSEIIKNLITIKAGIFTADPPIESAEKIQIGKNISNQYLFCLKMNAETLLELREY